MPEIAAHSIVFEGEYTTFNITAGSQHLEEGIINDSGLNYINVDTLCAEQAISCSKRETINLVLFRKYDLIISLLALGL
jgi:hypothetical protein